MITISGEFKVSKKNHELKNRVASARISLKISTLDEGVIFFIIQCSFEIIKYNNCKCRVSIIFLYFIIINLRLEIRA